jgi:hypothetical protein
MRLTVDEYCKHFKMSKEMVGTKIRAKKLNYIIENGITYIIVARKLVNENKISNEQKSNNIKNTMPAKPTTTVATVLALYQKENSALKSKISYLEAKIDKLIDDKEQMLRQEIDKIEKLYNTKDRQLKNILELINSKMELEKEQATLHEVESFASKERVEISHNSQEVELKKYLKSLGLKSSKRKAIKKRFLDVYDSDDRVILRDGKLYLDFSKYDYSELLG